jgi:hypothetical protein
MTNEQIRTIVVNLQNELPKGSPLQCEIRETPNHIYLMVEYLFHRDLKLLVKLEEQGALIRLETVTYSPRIRVIIHSDKQGI